MHRKRTGEKITLAMGLGVVFADFSAFALVGFGVGGGKGEDGFSVLGLLLDLAMVGPEVGFC